MALVSEHLALDITRTFDLLVLKSLVILNSFVLTTPERTGVCYFCLSDEKRSYRKGQRQIPKIICAFQSSLISVGVYVSVKCTPILWHLSRNEYVFTNFVF